MTDPRLKKLAKLMVEYSTKVEEGDNVYIQGEQVATPFLIEVAKEAILKGANVEYDIKIPQISEFKLKHGSEQQIKTPSEKI